MTLSLNSKVEFSTIRVSLFSSAAMESTFFDAVDSAPEFVVSRARPMVLGIEFLPLRGVEITLTVTISICLSSTITIHQVFSSFLSPLLLQNLVNVWHCLLAEREFRQHVLASIAVLVVNPK
jgi:hypothetical protein